LSNPYEPPSVTAPGGLVPHRATTVLILGVVSIMVCPFISVVPWVMGKKDLAAMDAGMMDPEGREFTNAGRILGMVGVILMVFGTIFYAAIIGLSVAFP